MPHHRHQDSLEAVLDFSAVEQPLPNPDQLNAARHVFDKIVRRFEHVERGGPANRQYNRALLLRYTCEYSLSDESRHLFLCSFFDAVDLPIEKAGSVNLDDPAVEERLRESVKNFADDLMYRFFLPLKAISSKTPQHTPDSQPAVSKTQEPEREYTGTPGRLSSLRGTCLKRDKHRCVITRMFDWNEAHRRIKTAGDKATDDDGATLSAPFTDLEVAHIMPHSLIALDKSVGAGATSSKPSALNILNMFDIGVAQLIEGSDIDRPTNAITLTQHYHKRFGAFEIFFTAVDDGPPHTYKIETLLPPALVGSALPVTRTLHLTEHRSIDPPSGRLLAVHRAIAHVLRLSAAGEYIDSVLKDLAAPVVPSGDTTDLAWLVQVQLAIGAH